MFHMKYLFYIILLHSIIATPQINLHYTDWVSKSASENNDNTLQHDCLRVTTSIKEASVTRQIISYCMSELSSKFNIEKNISFSKFTFHELSKENITSQQLYLWSAPIDIIERYQHYLDKSLTSNQTSNEFDIFHNCTLPRFGSMCQYEFLHQPLNLSSLNEIIYDFYSTYEYKPINFTCYTHLKCNRGPSPSCLDWSEICNGDVNCLDEQFDEEHCWQLELNNCDDNEFQCQNGQCIPQSFYLDDENLPDCLDGSDEIQINNKRKNCNKDEPSFGCEDITCKNTPLTSSCVEERKKLLVNAIYSIKDSSISEDCWSTLKCLFHGGDFDFLFCYKFCPPSECLTKIENDCPDMLYSPNIPILFGNVYFAFTKNDLKELDNRIFIPPYICYNNPHYDDLFINASKILFNNRTCSLRQLDMMPYTAFFLWKNQFSDFLSNIHRTLKRFNSIVNLNSTFCNRSNMYQCINSSKCISINRLIDQVIDCPNGDDENFNKTNNIDIMNQLKQRYYYCQITNKYIPRHAIKNGYCDCLYNNDGWCEDEHIDSNFTRRSISFQTICDGFIELLPIMINGQNQTDETECEQWECNNIYTRCDGLQNCPNGEDEIGCDLLSQLNCSSNHFTCVSPHTNQLMCISNKKMNDGYVDCLGATDELALCRSKDQRTESVKFYCIFENNRKCIEQKTLCDNYKHCINGDDEQFCENNQTFVLGICSKYVSISLSHTQRFLCDQIQNKERQGRIYFSLDEKNKLIVNQSSKHIDTGIIHLSSNLMLRKYQSRCHRGLDLQVWLNDKNNSTTRTCLCPPSFYGSKCQYQNQRISLAIKFHAYPDSLETLFGIIISLIDDSDKRIIHSYEQFTYLSIRDCKIKFNIYLIYSTRPKDKTKHYSIHIDIYEKISLNYRGSLLFPINFSFLPVHRLAFIANIPKTNDHNNQICSNDQCIHGKCIKYSNNLENKTFCQCEQGWSGRYCNISYKCTCSSNSLCIDISANNQSICLCPINKFGSRCFLTNTNCQNNNNSICKNNGQCIPNDEYIVSNKKFTCICPTGFNGTQCEIIDNKISLSFEKDIIISSQSIFIHFIEIINNDEPIRTTMLKTIPFMENSIEIYWSHPFHIVFIEFIDKTYYLTIVQNVYNQSTNIIKIINPSDRCLHINEIFNKTLLDFQLIRRIKYYHLPCQNSSLNLSCFYDNDDHFCLCYNYGQKRLSNCFNFNHNMKFDCLGENVCLNGGQCFQDKQDCPYKSICFCHSCYYGRQCQLSTSGFGLSLDAILGYHIIPNVNIKYQPTIINISLSLTIIVIIAGFINGILALITFKNKVVREVGCGLYLFGSSITTLIIMIIFGLKYSIFILTQMTIIKNELFLKIQCISLDYLLKMFLNLDQWLNACVACERAITTIKGTAFVKKKSRKAAKKVIIIIIIFIILSFIHDPFYRKIIIEENNDENEKRIWCTINYPYKSLQILNSTLDIIHFIVPFLINLISAIILITRKSHQQTNVQTRKTYKQLLREQFHEHKHLFTAPVVLVILGLPRLIITFMSKCMKSTKDSWLFLFLYFISLVPPILTFFVFILPSKFYKKEFKKSVAQYRTKIQRRLNLNR